MNSLKQNVWTNYGLRANPFDTKALSLEKNFLPIREAYVGRDKTSRENILITNILCNPGGCRFVVEGEIGVGKTSFVNYHRFLWENEAEDKILTIEREISVYEHWNIKDFLINILTAIAKRIQKLPQTKRILKQDNIFQEILLLGKVYKGQNQNYGVNAFNIGFSTEKSENINVPRIPEVQLLEYFSHLVSIIKKLGFVALFLHLDNLELIKNSNEINKVQNLFENLRDTLQTPDVYFAFVAYRGFFQNVISPRERLKSVFFGRAIYIPPLKKEEVVRAIEKRYSILKLPNREVIKPFEDDFINYLYDVYRGKIRFIMEAANTLVPFLSRENPKTLPSQIARKKLQEILYEEVMEKITPQEWKVLNIAVQAEYFTNKDIVEALKISKPNVSRIIKKLSQNQLITTMGKKGRNVSYQVFEDVRIIIDSDIKKYVKSDDKKRFSTVEKRTQKAMITIKQKITTKEYASMMNVSINIARNDLKYLVLNNKMVKQGSTKNAYFILKN